MMPNVENSGGASAVVKTGRVLVLSVIALLLGVAATAALDQMQGTTYPGRLNARKATLFSTGITKIHHINAPAGSKVKPGDRVVTLIDETLAARRREKQHELADAEAQLARAKAQAEVELLARSRDTDAEAFQTRLKMSALSQDLVNRQVEQLAWRDQLQKIDGELSLASVDHPFKSVVLRQTSHDEMRLRALLSEDAADAAVDSITSQISLCEERLAALDAAKKDLMTTLHVSCGVTVAERHVEHVTAELQAIDAEESKLTITSPTFGIVGVYHKNQNDWLEPHETVVEVFDADQLSVSLALPARQLGQFPMGREVDVLFPNRVTVPGRVTAIASQALPATNRVVEGEMVEVVISPAGNDWPILPLGSTVAVRAPVR
jgi:multidrug efflux pump subunit AcrA (membrane-fusion protein)